MNVWWMVLACSSEQKDATEPPPTSDPTCPAPDAPAERDPGSGPRPARTVTGEVAYHLDFDAAAEADGKVDCDYTRTYTGVEVVDQPWLCPACEVIFRADTEVDDLACYAEIGTAAQRHDEWIGFADGFWRTQVSNTDLSEYCATGGACSSDRVDGDGASFGFDSVPLVALDGVHGYSFEAVGAFAFGDAAVEVTPLDGYRAEPYACGWPQRSPGGPSPWSAAVGEVFPNFRQLDACGEPFDVWDLRGSYVVLVVDEVGHLGEGDYDAFQRILGSLNDDCIATELVVVAADSFVDLTTSADPEDVADFALVHGLTGPVLADAGVVNGLFGDVGGFDSLFPGGGLLAPDGTLLEVKTFDENPAAFERAIRDHHAGR